MVRLKSMLEKNEKDEERPKRKQENENESPNKKIKTLPQTEESKPQMTTSTKSITKTTTNIENTEKPSLTPDKQSPERQHSTNNKQQQVEHKNEEKPRLPIQEIAKLKRKQAEENQRKLEEFVNSTYEIRSKGNEDIISHVVNILDKKIRVKPVYNFKKVDFNAELNEYTFECEITVPSGPQGNLPFTAKGRGKNKNISKRLASSSLYRELIKRGYLNYDESEVEKV